MLPVPSQVHAMLRFGRRLRFGLPVLMLYFASAPSLAVRRSSSVRPSRVDAILRRRLYRHDHRPTAAEKGEGKRKKRQRIAKPREGFVFGRVVRQGRTGTMRRIDERMIRSLNNNEVLTIRHPSTNHGLKIMITPAVKDADPDAARSVDEAI